MTDAVSTFAVTIQPNTQKTLPRIVDCPLNWSNVTQIILTFPPGCAGLVGAQVRYASNPVYPVGSGNFFVLDDYVLPISVSNQRQGGQWSVAGYNNDVFPHTVTVYFYYDYLAAAQSSNQSGLISL